MSAFSTRRSLSSHLLLTGLALFGWLSLSSELPAQHESSPVQWLPKSTIVYLEISPSEIFLDHPIRKQIRKSEAFRKIWSHPALTQVRVGLTAIEFAMGEKMDSILRKLNHGGVRVVYDADTQGLVLLARTESEGWLTEYLEKLKEIARSDAKSKNLSDPIEEKVYRDIQGSKFQEAIIAPLGPWLMLTNKSDLARATIDRYRDSSQDTLATNQAFQSYRREDDNPITDPTSTVEAVSSQSLVRLFVDLETLRSAGVAKELLSPKRKDFGAELLLGGLLTSLQRSSSANAEFAITSTGFSLKAQLPIDVASLQESHAFFVGPESKGVSPPLVSVPGLVASLGVYRDISQLWLNAGDLFDQAVNDQLAQADSTLTTLFSGKDFAEDILGVIEPQLQIIVAKQAVRDSEFAPSIRLPAFALVGQLKDSGKMRRELKRTFQSLVGFLNIVGAMEGQPQLELMSDLKSEQDSQFYWAEYLLDADKTYENGLPIQFNFQPCIAFSGDKVAVASTVGIAKQIFSTAATEAESTSPQSDGANTDLFLNVQSIADLLEANRETLITNNVLEKGQTRQQAEEEISLLFTVISLVQELRASLFFDTGAELSLQLDLKSEENHGAK